MMSRNKGCWMRNDAGRLSLFMFMDGKAVLVKCREKKRGWCLVLIRKVCINVDERFSKMLSRARKVDTAGG